MKTLQAVFAFTFYDGLRKKFFIISTIFGLALILILCALPALLSGGDETPAEPGPAEPMEKTGTIYLLPGEIPGIAEAMAQAFPTDEIVLISETELESSVALAGESDRVAVVEIKEAGGLPLVSAHIQSFMQEGVAARAADAVRQAWITALLSAEGLSADLATLLTSDVPYVIALAGKMDFSGYLLGILIVCVMFFAIYYYGYGVAMSVATEKTSRVMEILVVAAKPRYLFWGKCLAMGALGLAQLTLFLAFGALCYDLLVPEGFLLMGLPLSLSAFTFSSAMLVLLYFLLGYFLYVVLNAASGAMVSRAEDVNAAMMPVMMVSMVAFFVAYTAALSGGGTLSRIALWIPFTSPFLMPFRLLNEQVPPADIAISVTTLIIGIVILSIISLRLYSVSVLHYGTRLKLRDIRKMR